MLHKTWENVRLPSEGRDELWEIFHENSKLGRYDSVLAPDVVSRRLSTLWESLPYEQYRTFELPTTLQPFKMSLAKAMTGRATARGMEPVPLSLATLATILYHGYGITRDNSDTGMPRPFRTVPSGGALYPLELFFHAGRVKHLPPGLYHYNPSHNVVRLLVGGDRSQDLCDGVAQGSLVLESSLVVFITALFERSTFKYGERGYRFVLLEAGHVAQNINLAATALELACVNVGGFFDRQIDELLGLDGLTHSTVYMICIGTKVDPAGRPQDSL